jgi:SAM-dependent methyltransferase
MAQSSKYDPAVDSARLALQAELSVEGDMAVLTPIISDLVSKDHYVRILDAGCGTGVGTILHFGDLEGCAVLGIDRSADAIAEAVVRGKQFNHIEFEQSELEELGDRRFDLVFCALVLHVVPDQQDFVELLWDLVEPGGVLVVRSLDDGLNITYPGSGDQQIIDTLTVEVFSGVDRFCGRKLAGQMSHLAGVDSLEYAVVPFSTLCRPGADGRETFFEVVHGWKTQAVMHLDQRNSNDAAQYAQLTSALEREQQRFSDEPGLFAAIHQVVITARKTLDAH